MARYIDHLSLQAPPKADPSAELNASLTALINNFPPQTEYDRHSCHGLYSGPTSIAHFFHHLSQTHPHLSINQQTPHSWCAAYLSGTRPHAPATPQNCGIGHETLSHLALSAAHSRSARSVNDFLAAASPVLSGGHSSNEWLYGRAGTLYLLRLIRSTNPHSHADIDRLSADIVDIILAEGPPWYWHGKEYLGAAHGSIGILTQIILSSPTSLPRVIPFLEELLDKQDAESGNWPSSPGSSSSPDRLVQFCHGAPGFVISLLAIRPYIARSTQSTGSASDRQSYTAILKRLDTAVEKGKDCVAKRGLLTKEPCLCHGAVGNAMAFEREDERREGFLRWCQGWVRERGVKEGWFREGDDRGEGGLFCGEAGRAWGWSMSVEMGGEGGGEGGEGGEGFIGYTDM